MMERGGGCWTLEQYHLGSSSSSSLSSSVTLGELLTLPELQGPHLQTGVLVPASRDAEGISGTTVNSAGWGLARPLLNISSHHSPKGQRRSQAQNGSPPSGLGAGKGALGNPAA